MSIVFDIFVDYRSNSPQQGKLTLAGNRDWSVFLIYVFTKDVIDLVEELKKLNVLLRDYQQGEVYYNFSVYIDQTQPDRCFVFCSEKKTKKCVSTVLFNSGALWLKMVAWLGRLPATSCRFCITLILKFWTWTICCLCWMPLLVRSGSIDKAGNCHLKWTQQMQSLGSTMIILNELNFT